MGIALTDEMKTMNESNGRAANALVIDSREVTPRPAGGTSSRVYYESPRPSVGSRLIRRWKWLTFCALVAGAAAAYVAHEYSTPSWRYETTLLYNENLAGHPDYVPPKLHTLASFATSRRMITTLRDEFQLAESPKAIAKSIGAEVAYGTPKIDLSVARDDEALAQSMLQRVVEIFRQEIAQIHEQGLSRCVKDFQANLQHVKEKEQRAKIAEAEFAREQQLTDITADVARVQTVISQLEKELAQAQWEKSTYGEQLQALTADPEAVAENSDGSDPATGDEDSVAGGPKGKSWLKAAQARASLQLRSIIKNRISDVRTEVADKHQLELLKNRLERVERLWKKQYVSDAEYEVVKAEYQALQDVFDNKDVRRWKTQVDRIDSELPDSLVKALADGNGAQNLAALMTTLELELIASEGRIESLDELLAQNQQKLAHLNSVRKQAVQLREEVDIAHDERIRLESRLATFEQLQRSNSDSLIVVEPVHLALDGESSNLKKLFVSTFAGVAVLLAFPVLLVDLLRGRERAPEKAARRLGLPLLAMRTSRRPKRNSPVMEDSTRLLALRLQQFHRQRGSVVMFNSLDRKDSLTALVARLAECLVQRGERVLIMDVENSRAGRQELARLLPAPQNGHAGHAGRGRRSRRSSLGTGLAEYLASTDMEVTDVIRSSPVVGADYIVSGEGPIPPEGLATRRLTDLLNRLRESYSFILIAGPTASRVVDLEMLAVQVDGIILNASSGGGIDKAEELVTNLLDIDAPVVGVVG